jgi:hypothetical protein
MSDLIARAASAFHEPGGGATTPVAAPVTFALGAIDHYAGHNGHKNSR